MNIRFFRDQLGREVHVSFPPQRIISLVPSQTELLADLRLTDRVVGITKFCVRPKNWFHSKTRVGGTKDVDMETVVSLRPDLIIANKEENILEQVEQLGSYAPVWVSDVDNLGAALDMILRIGDLTATSNHAQSIANAIRTGVGRMIPTSEEKSTVYLIWRAPYMTAGSDTFISDIMARCGLRNAITGKRYPELAIADLRTINPEVVLLSSEPYPFREKHLSEVRDILPNATVMLVDGEMFSWYGSRLIHATDYLNDLRNRIEPSQKA